MGILSNHTFLITRPEHQAAALCAQLTQLGGECQLLPTLHIAPVNTRDIANAINKLQRPIDTAIFTSANAVSPIIPYWSLIQPKVQPKTVLAIGPGTAHALQQLSIIAETPTQQPFTSEALLALPTLRNVKNQHIVIFSGEGGRTTLLDTLRQRGAFVEKIAVYRRELPTPLPTLPTTRTFTCIISTSQESLQNLWQIAGEKDRAWLCAQQLLVISHGMALLAQHLGFIHLAIIAANASDQAIVQAIVDWCD